MNSDKYIALANKLIQKNGRQITIQKLNTTSTGSTPWKENAVTYNEDLTRHLVGCFVPASGDFAKDIVSEDLISRVAQVVLIAPTDTDLDSHNVVIDGNTTWKIEWVKSLKPADKTLLYFVGIKQ